MPWDGFRRGKDCLCMLLSTNSKIVEHMPHLLFISRFAGSNGGIEGYQRDMARLLRGNGFTVDFAWLESGRDPEKFLPAFDANMTLDDALRRPDAYDLVVVHKLFDLDKLRAVQEHFRHTALFVHDHDIYCPRHHYYTPFGRTNCHRRFQTLRCGLCAFASHPKHWEGGLKAYGKSLFRDFPKRLEIFKGFPKIAVLSDFMRRNLVLKKMAENGYITDVECDSISQIPIDMSHFSVKDHNSGQATYFREFLRGELNEWAKNTTRADGQPYNIYRDGLRIYTTIDSRMQRYAEEAVKEFMGKELQPMFYKHWKGQKNAPFSNLTADEIDHILETSMKRTDRYRSLKNAGMPMDSIKADFERPVRMNVFSWNGPIDTVMSPMDSIRYYKWFLQASLISIESHTGHVKAYVGGLDYRFFKYDHVTQARRQVGSTFKPFLYSLAMQEGEYTPCTKIPNIQYNIQLEDGNVWSPGNSGGRVGEEISLKYALAQSNNWISAYLMNQFGPNAVIAQARRMGVESPIDAVPAICLGVCDLKLIEMVGAMSTFANQGVYIKPMFITRIEDKNGNVIQRFSPEESEAMSELTAYKMIELMKGVVQSGTGIRLRSLYGFNNPIAGKTGTTQKNSDGYFMGITPDLTTGVWVGAEDRSVHFRSTKLGQGSHTALPIWALYMKKVYADKNLGISKGDFTKPNIPGVDLNFDCNRYDNEESIEYIDEF